MKVCGARYVTLGGGTGTCTKPVGHKSLHGPADRDPVTRESLALDMGRDVLAKGLRPFLVLLVGAPNADRLIQESAGVTEPEVRRRGSVTFSEVVSRIETLEQTSASGAACDDLFAAMSKRIHELEQQLSPPTVAAKPTCTARLTLNGERYECARPQGHSDIHQDNDCDAWTTS